MFLAWECRKVETVVYYNNIAFTNQAKRLYIGLMLNKTPSGYPSKTVCFRPELGSRVCHPQDHILIAELNHLLDFRTILIKVQEPS